MRQQVQNVVYGVLDYVAYPAAMLLVAPLLMRALGVDGYGVWSVMAAVVSAASIIASGFGDAAIKQVSQFRADDQGAVLSTVRTLFLVSSLLAVVFALAVVALSPWIAKQMVDSNAILRMDCMTSLWIVSVLIIQRSVESVFITTQRAYERYGAAVRISVLARIGSLAIGACAALLFHRVWGVLLAAALCNIAATMLQSHRVRLLLHVDRLRPAWDIASMRELFRFGKYSWLLALSGVIFGQLDRLVLGMWLGASAIASYSVCAQIAQPIYGVAAAGLHVLFPYLSHRAAGGAYTRVKRAVLLASLTNLAFVVVAALALQTIGLHALTALGRFGLHNDSPYLFVTLLWSSALLGTSVVPTYALYALDRVHMVTAFNVCGALLCVCFMVVLGKHFGVEGIALARLGYGVVGMLLYLPLWQALGRKTSSLDLQTVLGGEA